MALKKYRKCIVCVSCLVLMLFLVSFSWVKMEGICRRLIGVKNSVDRKIEAIEMHKQIVDIDNLPVLEDEYDAWYTKYHFIAHSGGAVDGKLFTDSLEAWNTSYENGNRVIDADISLTTDDFLVLRHSWRDNLEQNKELPVKDSNSRVDRNGVTQYTLSYEDRVSLENFLKEKICFKYTPMTCADMLNYMVEHEDLYVACDMKDDVVESYRKLVDLAFSLNCSEVLDRIIVNLYKYEDFDSVMEVYDWKYFTMRQHYIAPNNYYELLEFCVTHDIHVVNVSKCYAEDEGVQMLKNHGIHVYTAVVDFISDMQYYYGLGVDGAVTDYLYESDWNYIK